MLDVATGTGAVARELVRRHGCRVVGLDQSAAMLEEARRTLPPRVELVLGEAQSLPFDEASFDGLTFTYLLRYIDDPATTLHELARVVKPGGTIASLEFGVPENAAARVVWDAYVGVGLPLAGRAVGRGWEEVGRFLSTSIESFWERYPLEAQLAWWEEAGIADVYVRRLTFGAGVVVWGRRA